MGRKKINTVRHLQKMMRGFFARKTCRELKKAKEEEKEFRKFMKKKNIRKTKPLIEKKSKEDFIQKLQPISNY